MRKGFIFRWVVNALGLLFVSWLFDGIQVNGVGWAFVAALFLGVFNALVRPVLILLTLPITVVTMGLFILVINALMLWLTGTLLAGFQVHGFWTAVGGALVLSVISMAANSLVGDRGNIEVIDMHRGSRGQWERRD
ncbi:MAG: phage holin family protein [Desulfarculaceae bacterium]|nr:phage holin family protein [Desulfarculaceae bacterium]MCF8045976.1 phage holin family protein [Desulfarculaceae bacterium]MCF8065717.1 phage holin family protein [Desulfarculaceae bacterium]MCF8097466.1 phage holin family protein [Desulfarculaceae bacterium]MCF8122454.1 phage holin family protein [Desulfarculaceae bacterium]